MGLLKDWFYCTLREDSSTTFSSSEGYFDFGRARNFAQYAKKKEFLRVSKTSKDHLRCMRNCKFEVRPHINPSSTRPPHTNGSLFRSSAGDSQRLISMEGQRLHVKDHSRAHVCGYAAISEANNPTNPAPKWRRKSTTARAATHHFERQHAACQASFRRQLPASTYQLRSLRLAFEICGSA